MKSPIFQLHYQNKEWIFERYLHQCASNTPSSYIKLWQEELKNTNNTAPIEKNQLQLHLQCKQAWIQLRTPHHKQTHYENLPKLKKIYEDMMTIKAPGAQQIHTNSRPKRNIDQNK
ncbi:hypothetical protein ACTFIY_000639 [Dictyostelium cf. discoideum]